MQGLLRLMRSTEPHLHHKWQITLHEVATTKLRKGAMVFERKANPPKRRSIVTAKPKAPR